ncbi:ABC transporter permease [Mycobacterium sp. PS03-16]|uniref:ABC transporter permease n=1 Tax=Mycobacterium sp. PS03-16 TaxID=2559611 RepID=UPI00142F87E1|nr:ABC transporter permease [Mycobacterium sp. PS03-16]
MTATRPTPAPSSLLVESVVFAGRLFTRWRREPVVPIQALLFPTFLLITYDLLVGESVVRLTGTDSLYGLVPMCALAGGMFGALGAGFSVSFEREQGLVTKFWTLPVHRASALTGRLLAETARTLLSTIFITLVGLALGMRFQGSWWTIIPFLLVPVLVVMVFAMAVIGISARASNRTALTWLGTSSIGFVFASSGVPPIELLPTVIQPIVRYQPIAPAIESMRAFALGEAAWTPFLVTLAWVLVLSAIVAPWAVRGYRAAAEAS